ncbi:hypothetical protein SBRCBS47491_008748 [Sporothrix bragantina]|uniref:Transcription initiation factor TFIID subunit 8 n=1 Tax=Sporothrix bragantina TaxID=671064 RepID=A0ABP0CRX5_9PEZI
MANAGQEASAASRKRPSPSVEDENGYRRSESAMELDGSPPHLNKRPRTASPKRPAGADTESDPYAFPDDTPSKNNTDVTKRIQSQSVAPTVEIAKTSTVPNAESRSPHLAAAGTTKGDALPPTTDHEVTKKTPTSSHADANKLKGGNSAPPQAQDAEPERAADTIMGGMEEGDRPSTGEKKPPTKSNTVPALPPGVKLRQPQKLKRLREQHEKELDEAEQHICLEKDPSEDDQARQGLRRALILALDHVGFSSATSNALESFLLMTETYIQSIAEDVTRFALAGRRSQPIPPDFGLSLDRFNIGTSALRPHLRNPIHPSKRVQQPSLTEPSEGYHVDKFRRLLERSGSDYGDLPLLGDELSGQSEKESKSYIPSSFPAFPSIHTYRNTPIDVDTVTVQGSGLRYDDGSMLLLPSEEATAEDRELGLGYAPLLDGTVRNRDPKRIREAATVEAKQAEEALRGLMRASKVNKLKEVRAAADRSSLNKKRYTLWEAAMRELIVDAKQQQQHKSGAVGPSQGIDASPSKAAKSAAAVIREEIADQSMMVNAEKMFHRKEIPRKARKVA